MCEFKIKVQGAATIVDADYFQNPKNITQNLWRVKLENGATTSTVLIPLSRDIKITKEWRKKLSVGSTLDFEGTLDKDNVVVTKINKIKREAYQAQMSFDVAA